MEWTVLGAGTLEGDPARSPSCHLLVAGGTALVDTGPGCLRSLSARGVPIEQIDTIVHSHRHLDHLADLLPLLFQRVAGRIDRPLCLVGAPGHEAFVRGVCDAVYGRLPGPGVRFDEVAPGPGAALPGLPGVHLRVWPAAHSQAAQILRFEQQGCAITYTGDTGPTALLRDAADGVDWLVAECTTPDDRPRQGHLTPASLRESCLDAGVRGVALVHLSPAWRGRSAATSLRSLWTVPEAIVDGEDGLTLRTGRRWGWR